ncbi:hypothetical protein GGH99_003241 [Coemansia sp. RSA 1285]|nr:hypothetical protein GGH99_003241 [Coemansia sp. RSA 1285]
MPLVTFDIDSALSEGEHAAQTEPDTAASASPSKKWQEGRAERIRSLESTLSAVVRRKQHIQQHKSGRSQPPATRGADYYGSMLDGEGGSDGSTSDGQTSDDNWDSMSDSSSFFYNEGRPLLCTYQPPLAPEDAAASAAQAPPVAGHDGSLSGSAVGAKAPEQFLPWDVQIWNNIRKLWFSSCACFYTWERDSGGLQ